MVFFSISSRHFVSMLHCIMKMSDFGDNNFLLELFSFIFIFHVDPFFSQKNTAVLNRYDCIVCRASITVCYTVIKAILLSTVVPLNRYHCRSLQALSLPFSQSSFSRALSLPLSKSVLAAPLLFILAWLVATTMTKPLSLPYLLDPLSQSLFGIFIDFFVR